MKTCTLSGILLLAGATAFAQPMLTSSIATLPVGFTTNIYQATATVAPGSGGAAVSWDISALTTSVVGSAKVITPSSSPYASTFPTANLVLELTPTSGSKVYSYDVISSSGWEEVASNYKGVGTGKDYTPNPESMVKFPFSYTDIFTDMFQTTTTGSSSVDISYDGYGTLKTPFGTYTNVVRVKKYWGPGDYDYNWYVTSPALFIIASFDAQNNSYTIAGNAPTTGVSNTAVASAKTTIYPNPFTDRATLSLDRTSFEQTTLSIFDINGRVLQQIPVNSRETIIDRKDLAPGIYLYQVSDRSSVIATGRLSVK